MARASLLNANSKACLTKRTRVATRGRVKEQNTKQCYTYKNHLNIHVNLSLTSNSNLVL